ncbi:hypothetical protein TL16_g03173 [Triparma laevis f. inornata]|uniref:NAD(P)-binding protein n=1 Tax=Triparma laevis f. inornata TaxID=1714386 RepID=A0A9W6ZV08_9STRA|nr:hypothetical protein TL16_g03173 [Triparma laevis f. inornata]
MITRILQILVAIAAAAIGLTIHYAASFPPVTSAQLSLPVGKVNGMNIVVTGGSSGIAVPAIQTLVERGANVYLTSRSAVRAQDAASKINEEAKKNECPMGYGEKVGTATGLGLDLADGDSINSFSDDLKKKLGDEKLDILVLNAGMVYPPDFDGGYSVTLAEGATPVDRQISANYLGHFKLVQLLKSRLTESRIIMTSR